MPTTDPQQPSTVAERTYSVAEAAHIICGDDSPASLHWLIMRLRGARQPRINGYKVARRWRMTQTDLDNAIEQLRPTEPTPAMTSLTARSRRLFAV